MAYIDERTQKFIDNIINGASNEELFKVERSPTSVQKEADTSVTANAQVLPLEFPTGYKQTLPQSSIYQDTANRAILKRQQDVSDLSANASDAYEKQAAYQAAVDKAAKDLSTPIEKYKTPEDLENKIKFYENRKQEVMPERDMWSEAIISFAPALLGSLTGESGALAAPAAAKQSREYYEKTRKELSDNITARNKAALEQYEKLLKVNKDKADLWLSEQKLSNDQKKAILDAGQFNVSTAQKDAAQAQNLASQAAGDVGKMTVQGAEKLAELETLPMTEANKQKRANTIATGQSFKDEMALRKELNDLKEVKDLKTIEVAYNKMKAAVNNPSPAGDMSIVFGAYNAWDPSSTVREGEYDRALKATGLPTQLRNALTKLKNGEILSPEQRADFLEQARNSYNAQLETAGRAQDQYLGIASQQGLNQKNITQKSKPIEKELSSKDKQALEWANKNPKDPRAAKIKQSLGVK